MKELPTGCKFADDEEIGLGCYRFIGMTTVREIRCIEMARHGSQKELLVATALKDGSDATPLMLEAAQHARSKGFENVSVCFSRNHHGGLTIEGILSQEALASWKEELMSRDQKTDDVVS